MDPLRKIGTKIHTEWQKDGKKRWQTRWARLLELGRETQRMIPWSVIMNDTAVPIHRGYGNSKIRAPWWWRLPVGQLDDVWTPFWNLTWQTPPFWHSDTPKKLMFQEGYGSFQVWSDLACDWCIRIPWKVTVCRHWALFAYIVFKKIIP